MLSFAFVTYLLQKSLFILMISAFFYSCSNDLDINAPKKEIIIVYGLLDANDSVHYIKVNKGFISKDKNAVEMAQDINNLFLKNVKVELFGPGSEYHLFALDSNIQKDTGVFANERNYLFSVAAKLKLGVKYQLKVTNLDNNEVAEAETFLVANPIPATPTGVLINSFQIEPEKDFLIRYKAGSGAVLYDIVVNMFYDEIDRNTQIVRRDTMRWQLTSGTFSTFGEINLRTKGQAFYDEVARRIEQMPANIERKPIALELEYWSGDLELSTYKNAYGGSLGVVQNKTDYTNIKNGYGLFASRNLYKITGTLFPNQIRLELKTNPQTAKLNFVN